MREKPLLITIILITVSTLVIAQNTLQTNHINFTQTLKIRSIPSLNNNYARLWDLANKQGGVIGGDFRGKQEIGSAAAERSRAGIDFWFPLNMFKKTIGGVLNKVSISDISDSLSTASGFIDYDHNFHITPIYDFQTDFNNAIDKAIQRMNGDDPYVDPSNTVKIGWPECSEDMKNKRIIELECEIDLSKGNASNFLTHNKPTFLREKELSANPDTLFAYGPWISDAGHCFKPEIHPAEQIWWKRHNSVIQDEYYLLFACDQSGRYDDTEDFDSNEIIGQNRYLKNVWAPVPLKSIFAILFAVEKGKEYIQLDINKIGNQNVTSSPFNNLNHYYLTNNSDTLAIVNYTSPEKLFKVTFEQIFSGFGTSNKTMVYGFITIEATVGSKAANEGGYLFLNIQKTIKPVLNKRVLTFPR